MPIVVSDLCIYPVKSTAGISLSRSAISSTGLAFDRSFVVCKPDGKFITARTNTRLLNIQSTLLPDGLLIAAPDMPDLYLKYSDFSDQYQEIIIWDDRIMAQICGNDTDRWFSDFLGLECSLLFFGSASDRPVHHRPNHQVAFADGYPLLLISEASLEALNSRCKSTIKMAQMRPNLVVKNTDPFAEDCWKRIKIGSVEFEIVKPCGRCILTTVDTDTLQRNPDREPLSVLKRYRKGEDGEAHFGQNLIALNKGVIAIGDPVEILETRIPEAYLDNG